MKIKIDTTNRTITLIESVSAEDLENLVNILTNKYGEDWKITIEENESKYYFPTYPSTDTPPILPYKVTSND